MLSEVGRSTFGPWIHAAQFNNTRKSVVEVAGFGEDAFIPSSEASMLNNPRKFNQTLTGSVHRLVNGFHWRWRKVVVVLIWGWGRCPRR